MSTPPAGWYPSPDRDGARRWWDGVRWTEHVRQDDPQPVPDAPTATVLDVSHVQPEYRQAAEAWHAMAERGGVAGTIGSVMSAALGAQEVAAPRPATPAAQYPPSALRTTDAPGVPMLAVGDLGFARTRDPVLQELQVRVDGGDDDLDVGPFGAMKAIGFGALLGLAGVVLLVVGPVAVAVILQLVGLAFVVVGVRALYVSARDVRNRVGEIGAVARALQARRPR